MKHAIQEDQIKSHIVHVLCMDTDFTVIAVAAFSLLYQEGLQQLWVAYGTPKKCRWIPIHSLVHSKLRVNYHAVTVFDNVSGIRGKGKKSCWETWLAFHRASETFALLSTPNVSMDNNFFQR